MENQNTSPLRKYVLTKKDKNIKELKEIALKWLKLSAENKLSYEVDWMGVPVIQTPQDLILFQELIFKVKPDYIVETGIAHGGGLIFYASILELINKGNVIGIDVEIKEHNRKIIEGHSLIKRIKMMEGDSVSPETIQEIRRIIPQNAKVIVILDSLHTKNHVLRELELYQDFIIPGCYIVVSDTFTSKMAELGAADKKYINNSPMEAVKEFLSKNNNFMIDKEFNKLFVSYSPEGYLKRVK